jgi:hypothetical protein
MCGRFERRSPWRAWRMRGLAVLHASIVAAIISASPGIASELFDRHQAICGDAPFRVTLTGAARDTDTCAARNACFLYLLTCHNGRQYALRWYLNPQALPHEKFYAQKYPRVQIAIFGFLLFFVAVARASGRHIQLPFFSTLWVPLCIIAVALFLSDIPARYPTQFNYRAFVWTGPVQLLVLSVSYVGIPGFLLCLLIPFIYGIPRVISGLDFMLRKHPAESAVLSALHAGKPIDPDAIGDALMPKASSLKAAQPVFRSKNQAARARAVKEQLDADAALAEAIERRERARAALLRAERDVQAAKGEKKS